MKKVCPSCKEEYETLDSRKKFCGRACAARYNNKGRKLTSEHREKVSKSLKRFYAENPDKIRKGTDAAKAVAKYTKGRHKAPKNIFNMSKRTTAKILSRLDLKCSRCDWNEEICDLHHIRGRKIKDPHNHRNLSYICPNCHRLAGSGKIAPEDLVSFEEQVGDKWKECYLG